MKKTKKQEPIPDKVITITVKTNEDKLCTISVDHTRNISMTDFIGILEQVKYNILLQLAKKL
jgi:hypothetical protein